MVSCRKGGGAKEGTGPLSGLTKLMMLWLMGCVALYCRKCGSLVKISAAGSTGAMVCHCTASAAPRFFEEYSKALRTLHRGLFA